MSIRLYGRLDEIRTRRTSDTMTNSRGNNVRLKLKINLRRQISTRYTATYHEVGVELVGVQQRWAGIEPIRHPHRINRVVPSHERRRRFPAGQRSRPRSNLEPRCRGHVYSQQEA